jgi:hypothetical protein
MMAAGIAIIILEIMIHAGLSSLLDIAVESSSVSNDIRPNPRPYQHADLVVVAVVVNFVSLVVNSVSLVANSFLNVLYFTQ